MNRIDISIIVNILIGLLIGGVLVWGLSQRELDVFRAKVGDLTLRVEYLERAQDDDAKVLYGPHGLAPAPVRP